MTATRAIHPKTRLPIDVHFDITVLCERCRRIQPLAHSVDDFERHFPNFPSNPIAGCLFCSHPYGRYAPISGGIDVAAASAKTRAGAPIAAHPLIPEGGQRA